MPPEDPQAVLRRYLAIPPHQRLKVVEDNVTAMVQLLLGNTETAVATNLPIHAVMLDVVREIRHIKEHLGLAGPKDPEPSAVDEVESPIVGSPKS